MASQLPELEVDEAFRTLLQCTSAAVVALDREGRVVAWSRGATRIFGWEEEEVLGERLPLIAPEQERDFQDQLAHLRAGQGVERLERRHLRKDGSAVPVAISIHPVHDARGEVTGALGLVTEREPSGAGDGKAEQKLRELRDQLAELEARSDLDGLPASFLLNSLHAVSVLLRKDEQERAVRTLSRLGALLRHVVAASRREWVRLREELTFLEDYVALESLRRGDGLEFGVRVENDVGNREIPSFLLLPLVERAVRRRAPTGETRRIRVEASESNGGLSLVVTDDVEERPEAAEETTRDESALEGLRRRLDRIEGASLELAAGDGGTVARIRLPTRGPEGGGQTAAVVGRPGSEGQEE